MSLRDWIPLIFRHDYNYVCCSVSRKKPFTTSKIKACFANFCHDFFVVFFDFPETFLRLSAPLFLNFSTKNLP